MLEDARFPSLTLVEHDGVLTVSMTAPEDLLPDAVGHADIHWELGELFGWLRGRLDYRVVVLTGARNGVFLRPRPSTTYLTAHRQDQLSDAARNYRMFAGVTRFHECIAALDKPVIARVNGDAIGFGQSVMLACDLIVAARGARVRDNHMEEAGDPNDSGHSGFGFPASLVPGDGGAALAPLFLTPTMAKEYLFLAQEFDVTRLHDLGVVNVVVDHGELDAAVAKIVAQLLAKSPFALAWAKRVVNRGIVDRLNSTLDAAAAYELCTIQQTVADQWRVHDSLHGAERLDGSHSL